MPNISNGLWQLLLVCLMLAGCQQSTPDGDAASDAEAGSTVPASAPGTPDAENDTPSAQAPAANPRREQVTLKILNWKQTQQLIAKHKGKVVVLDLWSTFCEPCMREFPNLVALHQKYGRDQVVCISGSCNYEGLGAPRDSQDEVLEFLRKQNATFDNVLFNVESEKLWQKLRIAAIPVVYVYGPDGTVAKRFDNEAGGEEFTYQKDIVPFIERLLAARDQETD